MNFGTIKDIFTLKLIESYSSEDDVLVKYGKDLYKKFLNTLKESETLKTAFIVFKNIETKNFKSEILANEYLNESISLFDGFKGKKSLKSEIKKLNKILESSNMDTKSHDFTTNELYNNLQNLITTPKNIHNLEKIQKSRKFVTEWMVKDKINISESKEEDLIRKDINPKKFLNIAVNKFNEKYKDSLNEEEKYILKVLRENNEDTIKNLVSSLVKETVTLVNKHLSESGKNTKIKEKLLDTKDVIYRMSEDNGDFNQNILKLYELKKSLN